jgi:hypothetical protein
MIARYKRVNPTTTVPLTQGECAIVDAADFEWLNQWKWRLYRSPWTSYAIADKKPFVGGQRGTIRMHRLIMGVAEHGHTETQVDHIDGNGLNNSRSNLRFATNQQNQFNRKIAKNNKSGHKGICWSKDRNKWKASIFINGKRVWEQYFSDIGEAVKAYRDVGLKFHGEFFRPQ